MSPQKKMKKRKELNALIGLSETRRKSKHRLLRSEPPDSQSDESGSEEREFPGGPSGLFGASSVQCCSLCYPLCVFILLAACIMACAGLIWMQIALKEDLDSLKEKIRTMDSSQKLSSHEILTLSEELKAGQMKLEDMESGERGLVKLWSNLTDISQKLSALDSAVNHLKANIKSSSDLLALPRSVEELQKSVASIGSTVTSLQHDVTMIQTVQDERREAQDQLKDTTIGGIPVNDSSWTALKQDVQCVQDGVSELNSSLLLHQSWCREQIQSVHFLLSNLSRWVSVLESGAEPSTAPAGRQLQSSADAGSPPPRRPRSPRSLSPRRLRRGRAVTFPVTDVEQLLSPGQQEERSEVSRQ
ncbi:EF-hand calcium-binding domain-containing protein 14 [Pimephales promelas]|uniref:EF-hand calcium-binding domain-containing protein 14 n=1 Tax=Pimephales promelas TaxID=90988 RepID=UPI0019555007|nr:EF-hand calcium-binding domain-containing protein 14 [Pimephales promelas]KAG1927448.1 EF-hand calcium-binding domain-containing protein [Pimephales promelas]